MKESSFIAVIHCVNSMGVHQGGPHSLAMGASSKIKCIAAITFRMVHGKLYQFPISPEGPFFGSQAINNAANFPFGKESWRTLVLTIR